MPVRVEVPLLLSGRSISPVLPPTVPPAPREPATGVPHFQTAHLECPWSQLGWCEEAFSMHLRFPGFPPWNALSTHSLCGKEKGEGGESEGVSALPYSQKGKGACVHSMCNSRKKGLLALESSTSTRSSREKPHCWRLSC